MTTLRFESLCEEVRRLPLPDLRRLRNLIDAVLANPALQGEVLSKRDRVDLTALASGLMSRIPPSPSEESIVQFNAYKPIAVQGEPVSETIIRERR